MFVMPFLIVSILILTFTNFLMMHSYSPNGSSMEFTGVIYFNIFSAFLVEVKQVVESVLLE